MYLATEGIKSAPVKLRAGPQRISASFPVKFDGPIEDEYRMVEQSLVDVSVGALPGMTTLPHLHELSITGPLKVAGVSDTPSRRKIFICRPLEGDDEIRCARQITAALARQAYRRPANENDVEGFLSFCQSGRNQGSFETGIRAVIRAIIARPEFVLRFRRVHANVP